MLYTDPSKIKGFKTAIDGLYEITMQGIGIAMKLAPYGVFALSIQSFFEPWSKHPCCIAQIYNSGISGPGDSPVYNLFTYSEVFW